METENDCLAILPSTFSTSCACAQGACAFLGPQGLTPCGPEKVLGLLKPKTYNLRPACSGFSTVEMLIAMTVLVLSISAVVLLSPGTQSLSVDAETDSEALNKAQEMLEQTQALARKDFKLVVPTTTTEAIGNVTYQKRIDASTLADYFTKKITATVSWMGMHNRPQSTSLSTLVTNFEQAVGGDTCDSIPTGNWASPQTTNLLFGNLSGIGDSAGTYIVTGVDAYQQRLYATTNQSTLTAGPITPGAAVDSNAVGAITWSNPMSARVSDNSRATATLSGTSVTHYITASNLGFAIPATATIVGISVSIERSRTNGTTGEARDAQVKIIKADGTPGSANKADVSTNWPTSDTNASYGSASDLWGEIWKPSDINNANFGVSIAATGSSGSTNRVASVDAIQITVTYAKQFYVFNISNPTNPILLGTLGSNSIGTGLNAVVVATSTGSNYAYVATNSTAAELEVIDVSSMPPRIMATYQLPNVSGTQATGKSIFYNNGYVYLGLSAAGVGNGPEFHIIDVHNPLVPVEIGYWPTAANDINNDINAIYVQGQYAYLAHPAGAPYNEQLTIVDISDPTHPKRVGGSYWNGASGGNGKAIFTVGDTLYLGRTATNLSGSADSVPELYALNMDSSNLAAVATTTLGTFSLTTSGDSINDILVRDYLSFLLTNSQLQIRQTNKTSPWTFAQYATPIMLPNSGAGVSLDCESNYMFAASLPASGTFLNRSSLSVVTAP